MGNEHLRDAAATPPDFSFFTDFVRQDSVADGGDVDFTAIATGTIAARAANGGWARVSGVATTDNSGGQVQALAAHACTDGKFIAFKAKAQLGEATSANVATDSDLYVGLLPVDTSIVASLPDDGIYFVKADGATTVTCVVRVAGANVFSRDLADSIDSAAHAYGIGVWPDGSDSRVQFIVDGAVVASAVGISLPADSVILTPSVAFQSGDATGTKYVDLDYLGSYQVR